MKRLIIIESALATLEGRLEQGVNNKDVLEEQIRCKKIELGNIIQYKTKGAIIRSKARWYNKVEKNSKYFLNLENRHCKRETEDIHIFTCYKSKMPYSRFL